MNIARILKSPWRSAAIRRLSRRGRKRAFAILMYHGLAREQLDVPNWCQVAESEFAAQMTFLAGHYTVLTLDEIVKRLRDGDPLPDHTAAITFDDAFNSVERLALPVLERHDLPATVFVATSLPDSGQPAWPDRLYLAIASASGDTVSALDRTWPLADAVRKQRAVDELLQHLRRMKPDKKDEVLARIEESTAGGPVRVNEDSPFSTMSWKTIERLSAHPLLTFGAHTRKHDELPLCAPEEQRREIAESRRTLAEHVPAPDLFAYPNGTYTQETRRIVEEAGYTAAVTTRHALNGAHADLFTLSRIGIGNGLDVPTFETKLLGL